MLTPRWRKVIRDLWNNKTRTILVVLSIAVGVAAIGMIAGAYSIITRELPGIYSEVNPTSGNIYAAPFDDEVVRVIQNLGIARNVEGRNTLRVTLKTGGENDKEINLRVIPDFQNIQINKIYSESGAWPPAKEEVLIERTAMALLQAKVGDRILVETSDGHQRALKISGLVHDLTIPSARFSNRVNGYITFKTLEALGYPRTYNELLFTVDGNSTNPEKVKQIANQIADKIRKGGRSTFAIVLANSGRLWFERFMTPMVTILGIMGIVILFMSALLVVNTISALIAQQIRQIGIMKSVGGTSGQIMTMYLVSMLVIGLAALAIALPLGILWTRVIVQVLTRIINFDIINFSIPSPVLFVQVILSLLIPLVAASFPIITGSRITVREAISDYGLSNAKFGSGAIDHLLSSIRGLPRPFLLSLRNTFRQKLRLLLTLAALAFGSAIFIAVLSVYGSLTKTLDEALNYYGFDLSVQFNRPYRIEQIASEINGFPGVTSAETWDTSSARIAFLDGSESDNLLLISPTKKSDLINPVVIAGRLLEPGDEDAIVINSDVLRIAPNIKPGQKITLNIDDKKSEWNVVGVIRSVLNGPTAYANYPYYSRTLGRYGLAGSSYIKVQDDHPLYQSAMANLVETHFERVGLKVGSIQTVAEMRSTAVNQYSVIFVFLMLMALLLTIVGGLGLTGTMSLNVLERTREIGVLRAVGASNTSVLQIVIFEGILIGIISWVIGIFLAFPLSWVLDLAVGTGFLNEPLQFTYSFGGVVIWFFVVIILATIASYLPARKAVQLTVRDVLAYE